MHSSNIAEATITPPLMQGGLVKSMLLVLRNPAAQRVHGTCIVHLPESKDIGIT